MSTATRGEICYGEVVALASDPVLVHHLEKGFVAANKLASDLTEYAQEELLSGMHPEDLLTAEELSARPVDWSSYQRGEIHRLERVLRCRSGRVVPVEITAHLIGEKVIWSSLRDISVRRQAEQRVRQLNTFYERVLDELPIEMAVFDSEGRYLFINPAALPDEELRAWLVGRTPTDYAEYRDLDPTIFEERERMIEEVFASGEVRRFEETITDQSGQTHHLMRILHPQRREDGSVWRLFAYGVDLTERKQFEIELREAKEVAEYANRLKTTFLTNVSHEIRTPLTTVIGLSEVLEEELKGEQGELVSLIRVAGERLMETVNSVLDLARLEGHDMRITPHRVDCVQVAREAVAELEPRAGTLELRYEGPEEPVHAHLDQKALHRILRHLLSNGLKFTEEGYVALLLQATQDQIVMKVRDTGIGISATDLDRIFGEFEQESTGVARSYEGTGLGLAITHRLVALLGGTISVQSQKGRGSIFIVTLPRHLGR